MGVGDQKPGKILAVWVTKPDPEKRRLSMLTCSGKSVILDLKENLRLWGAGRRGKNGKTKIIIIVICDENVTLSQL